MWFAKKSNCKMYHVKLMWLLAVLLQNILIARFADWNLLFFPNRKDFRFLMKLRVCECVSRTEEYAKNIITVFNLHIPYIWSHFPLTFPRCTSCNPSRRLPSSCQKAVHTGATGLSALLSTSLLECGISSKSNRRVLLTGATRLFVWLFTEINVVLKLPQ